MQLKDTFGEIIRKKRIEKNYPIRKVAAILDIDASTLSKIERDERTANKTMIHKLSEVLEIEESSLLISFLSDCVVSQLVNEISALDILKISEEKIKYIKASRVKQSKLNF